jgi:NAD(P)-dependent dehydrogenase (short-subunit alcohol dehydrogenase family)
MPQRILIIGNSDGIGAAVTRKLLARGDRVVGISRSPSPLGAEGPIHFIQDVSAPDYPDMLQQVIEEKGPFTACIYCVAIGSGLELPDLSKEATVIETNFTAMIRTFQALVPGWITTRSGHFVGLSSIADGFYNHLAPSYSASKAGFSSYLVSMALKLRPLGVHVTNIRFGFVDTKLPTVSWKPLMISSDRAAEHILECLDKKPVQYSVPKLMAGLVNGYRWLQSIQLWFR